MTRRTVFLVALGLAVVGCTNKAKEAQMQIAALAAAQDSIVRVADSAKTELAAIDLALQSTEAKLTGVKLLGERGGSITQRIDSINAEIDRQETEFRAQARRISTLRKEIADRDARIKVLTQRVDSLVSANKKLAEENSALRDSLEMVRSQNRQLQAKVSELTALLEARDNELAQKVQEINTAYYIAAPEDSLKKLKVIDTRGRTLFFGGRTAVTGNTNLKYLTKIDVTVDTVFRFPGTLPSEAHMYSVHPDGSYELAQDGTGSVLHITNVDEFWKGNKFLVMGLTPGSAPQGNPAQPIPGVN